MSADEARSFLLKEESYCTIDLPPYIHFGPLLNGIRTVLEGKKLPELWDQAPGDFEGVNHLILNNKDGRHAWRPLQLINPALYVSLVNRITEESNWKLILERFTTFAANDRIQCLSLPVEALTEEEDKAAQIGQWWQQVEQASIELALDFEHIVHTDIVDCYSDIYTHSIAWALHTRPESKKRENRRNPALIGNVLDRHIQDMRHGQTNGIPQGAVLMDFIAEMVLGYADAELTEKITANGITDYKILRYRDDYRIFVNSSQDGERILKCLTEVMIGLGLKLSATKTRVSNEVVTSSLKEDKLAWLSQRQSDRDLQKHLLVIHEHAARFPNAGSLVKPLQAFHARIAGLDKCNSPLPLISIVVDIAYRNPRTYALCCAILSKLISFLKTTEEKQSVIEKARQKFSQIPNTGHMQIWLQRVSLPFAPGMDFDEPLCRLVRGEKEAIWNNEWVSSGDLKKALDATQIVEAEKLKELEPVVPKAEVALFATMAELIS
jgi:RNA-directed DNA polymerase